MALSPPSPPSSVPSTSVPPASVLPTIVPPAGARRMLVAERSPTIALAIAEWLRSWGYHAEVARTEADAHAALGDASFDLLIADGAFTGLALAASRCLMLLSPGQATSGAALGCPTVARPVQPHALRAAVDAILAPGPDKADERAATEMPAIDLGVITELWGAPDSPAFRRIADVFLAEAPRRVAGVVTAHAASDRPRLAHEAHALAGAALNVGLPEVIRLARALEHAAPGRPLAELAAEVAALQEVAARDFAALQSLAAPA